MRLSILDHGHTPIQRLLLSFARRVFQNVPGPILTLSYRPRLFGRAFAACLQEAMRQSTHFEKRDCELIASFVARHNQCSY